MEDDDCETIKKRIAGVKEQGEKDSNNSKQMVIENLKKQIAAEKEARKKLEEEIKKLEDEIKKKGIEALRQRTIAAQAQEAAQRKYKLCMVSSVSKASNDPDRRRDYYKNVLGDSHDNGGILALKMYMEFLKAAHRMTPNEGNGVWADESKWDKVKKEFVEHAELHTKKRPGLFNGSTGVVGLENPQSAWAAHLLKLALDHVSAGFDIDARGIHTTHCLKFPFVGERDPSTMYISLAEKKQPSTEMADLPTPNLLQEAAEEKPPAKKPKLETTESENTENYPQMPNECDQSLEKLLKFTFGVDVVCWAQWKDYKVLSDDFLLCTVAYKPNNSNNEQRATQAAMCATNIFSLLQKPCIAVDIQGGTNCEEWTISASAISRQPNPEKVEAPYEKSELMVGTGVDGMLALAAGLLEARRCFPDSSGIPGNQLLGPVVRHDGCQAYKLYNKATYRQPNINIIRELLDEKAILWTSNGAEKEKLQLLEMRYFESDWSDNVKVCVFVKVLGQLQKLHAKFGPHGDIRLANILSNGKIIDFDFISEQENKQSKYPDLMMDISRDGERHAEVRRAIRYENSENLEMKKEHDYFSMAVVMNLFQDQSSNDTWASAVDKVKKGYLKDAIAVLEGVSENMVGLKNEHRKALFGMGGPI